MSTLASSIAEVATAVWLLIVGIRPAAVTVGDVAVGGVQIVS